MTRRWNGRNGWSPPKRVIDLTFVFPYKVHTYKIERRKNRSTSDKTWKFVELLEPLLNLALGSGVRWLGFTQQLEYLLQTRFLRPPVHHDKSGSRSKGKATKTINRIVSLFNFFHKRRVYVLFKYNVLDHIVRRATFSDPKDQSHTLGPASEAPPIILLRIQSRSHY